jgi:PqqA peptide cyclase
MAKGTPVGPPRLTSPRVRGEVDARSASGEGASARAPRSANAPHPDPLPASGERENALPRPLGLLAELTHRCPLGCPYCSNPLALETRHDELDTATWARVFGEAAALGVLQVHLSGGEPAARRDLVEIMASARDAGLYTNLITSGVGLTNERVGALADAGLDHVQISIQDSDAASADHIAGYDGAFARKRALAAEVVRRQLLLTVNAVVHSANIDRIGEMVDLALALGASRVEIAHVQYYGWALKNRAALMPTREQVERAAAVVDELRTRHHGRIVIDAVVPDYYARYPKPCVGGWGRRSLNVTPAGKVLPCHAAESITGLEFWNVRDRSLADIWANSPAFNAFRGTAWMKEPCASCPRRELDFGGCRCQAFALTGDATATDPICHLAPDHARVAELAAVRTDAPYVYRRMGSRHPADLFDGDHALSIQRHS